MNAKLGNCNSYFEAVMSVSFFGRGGGGGWEVGYCYTVLLLPVLLLQVGLFFVYLILKVPFTVEK